VHPVRLRWPSALRHTLSAATPSITNRTQNSATYPRRMIFILFLMMSMLLEVEVRTPGQRDQIVTLELGNRPPIRETLRKIDVGRS
jgi:hypothetical protein